AARCTLSTTRAPTLAKSARPTTEDSVFHRVAPRKQHLLTACPPLGPHYGRQLWILPPAFLGDPGGAFAAREFAGDLGGRNPDRRPQHEKMVENIGALADERGAVAPDALDDRLDGFLAELLRDLGGAAGAQPC